MTEDMQQYLIYTTKTGKPTTRRTTNTVIVEVLGNESFHRQHKGGIRAAYWGIELNNKLKHVTKSRDEARAYRREKWPTARVVALG